MSQIDPAGPRVSWRTAHSGMMAGRPRVIRLLHSQTRRPASVSWMLTTRAPAGDWTALADGRDFAADLRATQLPQPTDHRRPETGPFWRQKSIQRSHRRDGQGSLRGVVQTVQGEPMHSRRFTRRGASSSGWRHPPATGTRLPDQPSRRAPCRYSDATSLCSSRNDSELSENSAAGLLSSGGKR